MAFYDAKVVLNFSSILEELDGCFVIEEEWTNLLDIQPRQCETMSLSLDSPTSQPYGILLMMNMIGS